MEFTQEDALSPERKAELAEKYKRLSGADKLIIALYATVSVAICGSVALTVWGLVNYDKGTKTLAAGVVGCVLTGVFIIAAYLIFYFSKKRALARVEILKQLSALYGEDNLIKWSAKGSPSAPQEKIAE